jgi:subtilase family protein
VARRFCDESPKARDEAVSRQANVRTPVAHRASSERSQLMKRALAIAVASWLVLVGIGTAAHAGKPVTKLTQELTDLHADYVSAQALGVPHQPRHPLMPVAGNWVTIDASASIDVNALQADLLALGARDVISAGRLVSARLPLSAIPALEALTSLQFARPAYMATNAGVVTSQGDRAVRADTVRARLGVTGSGVTVGVLSDSFNCTGGAPIDVSNDDLSPVNVLQDEPGCGWGTDEGRAMLQIVHDVAPGASLAFATAEGGQAALAANIAALKNSGARVILDDIIYFEEPFFLDGVVAKAVDAVVAQGATYFSAAGNQARQSYEQVFVPGTSFPPGSFPPAPGVPVAFAGGVAHDFGGSVFQRITIPAQSAIGISLQWDSPFFSVSGPGTPNDVDVYLLDAAGTQIVAASANGNVASTGGSGDPTEVLLFFNAAPFAADFNIMIVKFSGPNPGRLKYLLFEAGGPTTIQTFVTNSGTVVGHANARGAIAVGAADYRRTPVFGVSPAVLEPFSSRGATPILFDAAGIRLATADLRAPKPELVAPDGVDTTLFTVGIDVDGNGFPNFFGTSAAVPHAAGVAALLLQNQPTLTPSDVRTVLESTALDMGAAGVDNDAGFGLVQADVALALFSTSLAIDKTSVNSGQIVTVTVTDGLSDPTDWVGLFPVGAPNTGHVDWKYLNGTKTAPGAGSPTASLAFTMPPFGGTFEFRIFARNGFARLAMSPSVIVIPATLTPSAAAVSGGATVTVTVTNGPGNPTDWVGLFRQGTADTSSVNWQYLNGSKTPPGAGVTTASVVFAMPPAGGTFEFRFFANNGFTRLATSSAVAVAHLDPVLTPLAAAVAGGAPVGLTVTNSPGNNTDWVGLFQVGAPDTNFLDWQYLNGAKRLPVTGLFSASLSFVIPPGGPFEFRLFSGAFTRLVTSVPVSVLASTLTPSAPAVSGGAAVTVAMTNGPGNPTDWLGLFRQGAADTSSLSWQYLNGSKTPPGAGLTTASVVFAMPLGGGTFEFRFFASDGFTRLATSSTVTVSPVAPTLAPLSAAVPGGATVGLAVTNSPGNTTDWVGLFRQGAADTSFLDWQYLNGTKTLPLAGLNNASLRFAIPLGPPVEFRLFAGSFTRLATSAPVDVLVSTLTPSAQTVTGGATVTVTVANGPANATDWVGLFSQGAADSHSVSWQYLNGTSTPPGAGLSNATLTFTVPPTGGPFEFRFFTNDSFTRLATSSGVTIASAAFPLDAAPVNIATAPATGRRALESFVSERDLAAGGWRRDALSLLGHRGRGHEPARTSHASAWSRGPGLGPLARSG